MTTERLSDYHRIMLTNLYRDQITRFGLTRWKKHAKRIVAAAHKRVLKELP